MCLPLETTLRPLPHERSTRPSPKTTLLALEVRPQGRLTQTRSYVCARQPLGGGHERPDRTTVATSCQPPNLASRPRGKTKAPRDRASCVYRFFLPRVACFPPLLRLFPRLRFFLWPTFLAFGQPVTEIFVL
jgi:hypothetical protein